MTLNKIFFMLAVGVLNFSTNAQQNPTDDDWNHYFNALFLPENSSESESASQQISHPQLKNDLFSAPGSTSNRARQDNAPAPSSSESVQSLNSKALADVDEVSNAASIIQLPDKIATAEQHGAADLLTEYYSQYHSVYPLHKNVYLYARNLLNSVPTGGWLVVQGQLDTYPLRALQINEGLRSDVQIVNLNWLRNSARYRDEMASKLPDKPGWKSGDSARQLIQQMRTAISGDLFLSMTLSPEVLQSFAASLQPSGLVFKLSDGALLPERHHAILADVNWNIVTAPALPEYVEALQQNYVAALLLDAKLGNPESLGATNRSEILELLYEQRSLRFAGENYLQSK